VNGARVSVANKNFFGMIAALAEVKPVGDDGTYALRDTPAATSRASGSRRPARLHTVNGARLSEASSTGRKSRARKPIHELVSDNGARVSFGASAARLGARAIGRPA